MTTERIGTSERTVLPEWPTDRTVCLTLDLEFDFAGLCPQTSLEAARQMPRLVRILERHDVPLSCFLQTELLDEAPDVVETLETADIPVEFHCHTHTHPLREDADVAFEIAESVKRIRAEFGTEPLGFRFPEGVTRDGDLAALSEYDIAFDSSLFPTWRPGRFNNLREPRTPYLHEGLDIVELPFSTYSKYLPVPVAMSYFNLLGTVYQMAAMRNPPSTIVFDMHMHDLVQTTAIEALPKHYQYLFSRGNGSGLNTFESFIEALANREYQFSLMSNLYETVDEALR